MSSALVPLVVQAACPLLAAMARLAHLPSSGSVVLALLLAAMAATAQASMSATADAAMRFLVGAPPAGSEKPNATAAPPATLEAHLLLSAAMSEDFAISQGLSGSWRQTELDEFDGREIHTAGYEWDEPRDADIHEFSANGARGVIFRASNPVVFAQGEDTIPIPKAPLADSRELCVALLAPAGGRTRVLAQSELASRSPCSGLASLARLVALEL